MAWRKFDDEDLALLKDVLDSGNLAATNGAQTTAFQEEFAAEFGAPHALGLTNAMAGLHCGVAAAGVQPGDEVIVDPMVVFAALGVLYHNGVPVFADVKRDTHLMDPVSLRERITDRTKAVIVTNLWGLCADYDEINAIAREAGIIVIEDCAHAIYATYKDTYAGCSGDIGVYSFQMSKQMALGDGGMVVCKDPEHLRIMTELGTFGSLPTCISWNYRINELTSAVGRAQLRRTRGYVDDCIAAANLYSAAVAGCDWLAPQAVPDDCVNTYHIWTAIFDGDEHGISSEDFTRVCGEVGFARRLGYLEGKPAYLHPQITEPVGYGKGCPTHCPHATNELRYQPGTCPNAEYLLPRIMLVSTSGGIETHEKPAALLAKVVERLG